MASDSQRSLHTVTDINAVLRPALRCVTHSHR